MDGDHRRLGGALQWLFTSLVEEKNQELLVGQRQRKLSPVGLVQLLVFGWINNPRQSFVELALQAQVSAQALQQRLTDKAVALFQAVLTAGLKQVFTARRPLIPLLQRFSGIQVHDSTQVPLPASLVGTFPACGGLDGRRGQAGWKLLIRFDTLTGRLLPFELLPGKTSDRHDGAQALAGLAAGMLHLADLGYFALDQLRLVLEIGAHYITRLPARVDVAGADGVGQLLGLWLKRRVSDTIDESVWIGNERPLQTRLVAFRMPDSIAAERRRKLTAKSRKRGRTVSVNQLELCGWWVGVTDLPATNLSADEIRTLYGLRWQIELLFKHWKQSGGLGVIHGRTAASVQVEYLAKLVGVLVTHWQALLAGGPLEGKNRMAVHRSVRAACLKLQAVLQATGMLKDIEAILDELAAALARIRRRPRRNRTPTTRQRLYGKRVAA